MLFLLHMYINVSVRSSLVSDYVSETVESACDRSSCAFFCVKGLRTVWLKPAWLKTDCCRIELCILRMVIWNVLLVNIVV